ncbi:MAG: CPBP family intramembrane metalloprotease [Candidatus Cloacimonetes bacterium]|nr:CPBP family intramembrane metalloprotease [Candidatus Cloacimonadota bacterium]
MEKIVEINTYPTIKNAIMLCLILLGLNIALGFLIQIGQTLGFFPNIVLQKNVVLGLVNIMSFFVVLFIGFKKTKKSFNEVFKFNKVSPNLWCATIIFSFGLVIIASELDNLLFFLIPMPDFLKQIMDELMVGNLIISVFMIGAVAALTEELFFRGLILEGFTNNYTKNKAILFSALIFGFIHLNPWQFLTAFLFGFITAFITIETNSILLPLFIHFFNNSLYTISVKFKDIVSISGFNVYSMNESGFQPAWFTLSGIFFIMLGSLIFIKWKKNQAPKVSKNL